MLAREDGELDDGRLHSSTACYQRTQVATVGAGQLGLNHGAIPPFPQEPHSIFYFDCN